MSSKTHIPTLDGLRAMAILLVLGTHAPREFGALHRGIPQILGAGGYLGVDLFFVLSGFLITRLLLADRERGAPLYQFIVRRFLRIFPIYYLLLLVFFALRPGPELPWCAAYLSNYYFVSASAHHPLRHTWSLAVEEHFYLFWPLCVYGLSRARSLALLRWVLLPGSLAASLALVLLRMPFAAGYIYSGTQSRMWSLGLGCLVAYFHEDRLAPAKLTPRLVGTLVAAGVGLLALSVLLARNPLSPVANLIAYSGISLFLLLVALLSSRSAGEGSAQSLVRAALTHPMMAYIGRISYGLYLFHAPIYYVVFEHSRAGAANGGVGRLLLSIPVALALTVLAASLSFRFLETPVLRLKARFGGQPA